MLDTLPSLAPNVAIVAIFIWYLVKKDHMQESIFRSLNSRLDQLARVIASLEDRLKSIEVARIDEKIKTNGGEK